MTPTIAISTPLLVPASAAESFSLVSTPTEESLCSLDVASTPSFDAVFSDDVDVSPRDDVPPCASVEPRAREVWNLLVHP